MFFLLAATLLGLASLSCTVTITTAEPATDIAPWTPETLLVLGVVIPLFITGGVGVLSTLAKSQNLASRVYERITTILVIGGFGLIFLGLASNPALAVTTGIVLIALSCPWGLWGDRLFK